MLLEFDVKGLHFSKILFSRLDGIGRTVRDKVGAVVGHTVFIELKSVPAHAGVVTDRDNGDANETGNNRLNKDCFKLRVLIGVACKDAES